MGSVQLGGISSWLSAKLDGLVEKILQIFITPLAMLLYSLQIGFFWLVDCVQGIFRKMAGLDVYYYQGEERSGDIVFSMITSDTIMTIFWSVLIVAIMLLFVTTFVAFIRVEFTEKGAGNAKGPIIGRAIKSLFYFACVPIVCIFGIWIANVFLRSLDKATSNQSYALSTTVFFAASHDANRCRSDSAFAEKIKNSAVGEYIGVKGTSATQEEIALKIDNLFLQRAETPGDHKFDIKGSGTDHMFVISLLKGGTLTADTFDCSNFAITYYFYDLFLGYNYLIGFMGGFVAASLLLSSCIAIIQRIFELSILFVISPTVVAFMPIDDGKKYGQWKGEFIKRVGMMYGPVIGLNLMFIILATLRDVDIFYPDTGLNAVFNSIVQLIFLIVGLISVKEFSGLISGLVGSSDAMGSGEGKKEAVQKMVGRTGAGMVTAGRMGLEGARATRATLRSRGLSLDRNAENYAKDVEKGIENGKFYRDKDGNLKKSTFGINKGLVSMGLKKGSELSDEDKKNAGKLATIYANNKYGTEGLMDEQGNIIEGSKTNRMKKDETAEKNKWGNQIKMGIAGDGNKTGFFSAYQNFAAAAGKDVSYFTRKAMADRAGSGEGALGNMQIWGDGVSAKDRLLGRGKTLGAWDAGMKKADEADKAQKDKQALVDLMNKSGINVNGASGGAGVGTGTGQNDGKNDGKTGDTKHEHDQGDHGAVQDVHIVADDTDPKNGEKGEKPPIIPPDIIDGLNSAVANLKTAASVLGESGSKMKDVAQEIKNATGDMKRDISGVAKELPNQVYRAFKEKNGK